MNDVTHSGLHGKVAIVTGATAGLGRAVALKLAAQGAIVVATGRNRSAGDEVVREIEAAGGRAAFMPAELEDLAATRAMVAQAVAQFGSVDILVASAGAPPGAQAPFGLAKPENVADVAAFLVSEA